MKINENRWKSIKIDENLLKSIKIFEKRCKSMQIHKNLQKTPAAAGKTSTELIYVIKSRNKHFPEKQLSHG